MKNCLQCNEPFEGRKDKRFCSKSCTQKYNKIKEKEESKKTLEEARKGVNWL